ncbi:MAG TPA: hypothetical protein VM122_00290, partial [Usitatibacter sp.]|nr:hypothetical protein [Usitatibacter sp.]
PLLRRLERTAWIACLVMAAAAYVISRGQWRPVFGVLGGGLLIAVSYRTIGSGVSGLVERIARPAGASGTPPPGVGKTVVLVVFRYALLALLAYVMIARLRLHPLGLLAGASSVVAAATVEAFRLFTKKS